MPDFFAYVPFYEWMNYYYSTENFLINSEFYDSKKIYNLLTNNELYDIKNL